MKHEQGASRERRCILNVDDNESGRYVKTRVLQPGAAMK